MGPPPASDAPLSAYAQRVVDTWALPGMAIGVVRDGDRVATRSFGTRDRRTGRPVTEDTLFHLASISKTFVATAVMQLVEGGQLELDRSVAAYLPGPAPSGARATSITVRQLLSHTSGLGDVSDYGWHEPELDDGALGRFAARVAGWTLERDPGADFAYSNAGYELLGHLVATVGGTTFEAHLKDRVLDPAGMTTSTFLRSDVPAGQAASPHLGLPPRGVEGAYPYTRRHAPSSTLHSSAAELSRWMVAHLAGGRGLMSPATHEVMWAPVAGTGGDFQREMALGWFWGTTFTLTKAALDVLLGEDLADPPAPPVTVALAGALEESGVARAVELYRRLEAEGAAYDLGEDGFADAVWGVIEMHRTDLAWPLLEVWATVQPDSAQMELSTGWAHEIDGRREQAVQHLSRAVELDPEDEEASTMLRQLAAGA
ncbi:serine hydrolase domain-containing protein [Ornithinimicrobium flavum]|uniref:serine hydrolase domain-containing protein n=1 Tax=Ornithinimicrobium flavum TaxID=1288636 RepID=UPI00106FE518|nr:serine hydrolase domain-containing protein [Ornithinimicrobium flavum]